MAKTDGVKSVLSAMPAKMGIRSFTGGKLQGMGKNHSVLYTGGKAVKGGRKRG